MHKASFLGNLRASHQRGKNMGSQQRLTAAMALAAPVQMFTPDQQEFRDNVIGLWPADSLIGPHAAAHLVRSHDDGTTDVIGLCQSDTHWMDLGGQGGRDCAAGRP